MVLRAKDKKVTNQTIVGNFCKTLCKIKTKIHPKGKSKSVMLRFFGGLFFIVRHGIDFASWQLCSNLKYEKLIKFILN